MLSQRASKYIKSYVIVDLNSSNYEKILNILRRKSVVIWDVKKTKAGVVFKVSKIDYDKNVELFNNIGISPKKKVGLVYKLNKLSVRIGFIVGFILIAVYLFVYCSFIWGFEVIGNEKLKESEIINYLEENGIKLPLKTSQIDKYNIKNLLYNQYKELKFVEIHIEGVKLVVFLREKKEIEYEESEDFPSSIISNKQAVIYKTVVKHGELLVSEGQVVDKGQVLVQGTKKTQDNTNVLINSDATIMGYTYYNIKKTEPKIRDIYKETGNNNSVYKLIFGNKKIKLFGNESKYEYKSEKIELVKIPLITDFLKISFEKIKIYELILEKELISKEYAQSKLLIDVYNDLTSMCHNNSSIYKKNIEFNENENEYIINAKIEMIEEIGEEIKIHSLGVQNENSNSEQDENN